MMENAFIPIMDREKTTRYILKTFPERADALFSPHLNWKEVETIMWRALSSPFKKEGPVVFKVGTMAPPGTPWLTVPETLAFPKIEQGLARGKSQSKIYGGGVMGDDAEVLRKMAAGELDDCGCSALGIMEACPEASVLMLPGLFRNYDEVDYIVEKFRKQLDESFEKNGYNLLALIDTGFLYIFSNNRIINLSDVRKEKAVSWFGNIEKALFAELRINTVSVDVPDLVSTIGTSQDTVLTMAPASWMLGMQAYQYVNFYFKQPLIYSPAAIITGSYFKEHIQQHVDASAIFTDNYVQAIAFEWSAFEKEWKSQIRSYEKKCLQAFETKIGMKVLTFTPEDQQAIEKAYKAVQEKLAGKLFPKAFLDDIQKALEEYRVTH